MPAPRIQRAPTSSAGSTEPSSPRTCTSDPTGTPTVPTRAGASSGVAVICDAPSVIPQLTTSGTSPSACRTGSGSGAEALRTNRSPAGKSSGPVFARTARIAGTALSHVIRRSARSSQNPVRRNRRSTTRVAPATRVASSPTTSALTWKSGSELNPRSSGVSRLCRATARATNSSCDSGSSTPFGVPVEPEVNSTTDPSPGASGLAVGRSPSRTPAGRNVAASIPLAGAPGMVASTARSVTTSEAPPIRSARRPGSVVGCPVSTGIARRPVARAARCTTAKESGSPRSTRTAPDGATPIASNVEDHADTASSSAR